MLIYSAKPITAYSIDSDHVFRSKKGDKRTCSICGEYWKHSKHDYSFSGKVEGMLFDDYVKIADYLKSVSDANDCNFIAETSRIN